MACASARPSRRPRSPSPWDQAGRPQNPPPGSGSIIVVVATDAPLLPHQCERLAQRAGLGIARVGGTGGHTSGDLFIAFATGNRLPSGPGVDDETQGTRHVRRQGRRRRRHRPAVRGDHRVDRGGHRQRAGRGPDGHRPRRHHGPRPAPRPAARGHGRGRAARRGLSVGSGADVTIRPALEADVPTLDEIVRASQSGGDAPAPRPAVHHGYLTHLVRRGRVLVADLDGAAVGFGAAVDTGRSRHLADLFVRPTAQGRGIGGRLLAELYEDAWPRTTFGSDDPRAVPLYLRAGMQAYWPNLYLDGDPSTLPAVDGLDVVDAPLDDGRRPRARVGRRRPRTGPALLVDAARRPPVRRATRRPDRRSGHRAGRLDGVGRTDPRSDGRPRRSGAGRPARRARATAWPGRPSAVAASRAPRRSPATCSSSASGSSTATRTWPATRPSSTPSARS